MTSKERINEYINEGISFLGKQLTSSDTEFISWNNSLIRFCEEIYGKDSTTTKMFKDRDYCIYVFGDIPKSEYVEAFEKDLKITIADLKRLYKEEDICIENKDSKNLENSEINNIPNFNVNFINNNDNMNLNKNSSTIIILSENEIKNKIEENSYLGDNEKKELLDLLVKIEETKLSKESNEKKWNTLKWCLNFLADKGADVVIMFLPKIVEAIQKIL